MGKIKSDLMLSY